MKKLNLLFVMSVLVMSSHAFADATLKADREAINAACKAEATTAGCGDEVVGKGLLKCIHGYKKANQKTFTISDGCKTAMKQLHGDRAAEKGAAAAPAAAAPAKK